MHFKLFKGLPDGGRLHVATRNSREELESLLEALAEHWPGDYSIEETGELEETGEP